MYSKSFFKRQNIPFLLQVLSSVGIIVVGIVILREGLFWGLFYLAVILMMASDIVTKLTAFFLGAKNKVEKSSLLFVVGEIVVILILVLRSYWFEPVMTLVFGFWILFNAASRFFAFVIAYRDKLNIRVVLFIEGLFSFVMSMIIISNWTTTGMLVTITMAVYLIVYGILQLFSALNSLSQNKIKDSIRMPLPIFLAAFIPYQVVDTINKMVKQDVAVLSSPSQAQSRKHLVSINFYMKSHGHERFGHVDIGWKGKIYSYGCHDPYHRSRTFFFGDGVLIVANQEQFLVSEVSSQDKRIVQFVCRLNDEQEQKFENGLAELMATTIPFDYPLDKDIHHEHYITNLIDDGVEAKFYKFKKGWFRNYFVLTTNCVLLVETLFSKTGIKLFNINGIITPGTYYDVLDNAYRTNDPIIVDKLIFSSFEQTKKSKSV